jgi:hypothetical protein
MKNTVGTAALGARLVGLIENWYTRKEFGKASEIRHLSQTVTSLRSNTPERHEFHPGQRCHPHG